MSINEIIVYIMVLFMALGALDRIIGNLFPMIRSKAPRAINRTMI